MIGVIVAAHADLAHALLQTAALVVPEIVNALAVGIEDEDDADSYSKKLELAVDRVRTPRGVLILTDMFGGTPSNVGLTFHNPGSIEVLTGANLPMLIKALQLSRGDADLSELALAVKRSGKRAISVATEVLAPAKAETSS